MIYSRNTQLPTTEVPTIDRKIWEVYPTLHPKYHLPKSDLVDGQWYFGKCRNTSQARWSAEKQRFEYIRTKFSFKFREEICCPEDDKYFDVFYAKDPIRLDEVQEPLETLIKDEVESGLEEK